MVGQSWDFLVDRSEIGRGRLVRHTEPPSIESAGEILVKLRLLAISANSATYVGLGEQLGYWSFFPSADGWGRFPAWGVGEVVDTHHDGFSVGERIFGFLPPSTHLVMRPAAVRAAHFLDGGAHRRALHPAYNHYVRLDGDPYPRALPEDWLALLRPLFLASFLLNDHLADAGWFGAGQLLITSASSKTALGLALLHQVHGTARPALVGVTSARHLSFVRGTGLFDAVLDYRDLEAAHLGSLAVVDFAGDPHLLPALQRASRNQIKQWIAVGATHSSDLPAGGEMDAFVKRLFFAPDHLRARMEKESAAAFEGRFGSALAGFHEAARTWLALHEWHGPDRFGDLYAQLIRGELAHDQGHIFYP